MLNCQIFGIFFFLFVCFSFFGLGLLPLRYQLLDVSAQSQLQKQQAMEMGGVFQLGFG